MAAKVVTSAQMRAIEAAAIASGTVMGRVLMERAGQGVLAAIIAEWPGLAGGGVRAPGLPGVRGRSAGHEYLDQEEAEAPRRAMVLCGPGNNGGDGYVVARLLADRGWGVAVFALGDPARLPLDARANFERAGRVLALTGENLRAAVPGAGRLPDLVVDALFGIGLTRPLPPGLLRGWAGFCDHVAGFGDLGATARVAVDVPSGVNADGGDLGRLRGFEAKTGVLTVTFHALKPAHLTMIAAGERVIVQGIGLTGGEGE